MSEVRIVSAPFGGWDARVLEEHPDGHLRVEVLAQEGGRGAAKEPKGPNRLARQARRGGSSHEPRQASGRSPHESSPSEDGLERFASDAVGRAARS